MEACIEFVLQIVSVMFTKEQVEGTGVLSKSTLISVDYHFIPLTLSISTTKQTQSHLGLVKRNPIANMAKGEACVLEALPASPAPCTPG